MKPTPGAPPPSTEAPPPIASAILKKKVTPLPPPDFKALRGILNELTHVFVPEGVEGEKGKP